MIETEKRNDFNSADLERWIGRREAFGAIASKCSAADVEILARIRDDRLWTCCSPSWENFCKDHLRVARRTADREIGYLRQYGHAFFTIRQLTHISAADYHLIADRISEQGIQLDGALVPLSQDQALAEAIGKLLQDSERAHPHRGHFEALLNRCQEFVKVLMEYGKLKKDEQRPFVDAMVAIENAADRLLEDYRFR